MGSLKGLSLRCVVSLISQFFLLIIIFGVPGVGEEFIWCILADQMMFFSYGFGCMALFWIPISSFHLNHLTFLFG